MFPRARDSISRSSPIVSASVLSSMFGPIVKFFQVNNAVKSDAKIQYKDFKKLNGEVALKMALSNPKVVDFLGGRDVLGVDCNIINSYNATLNIQVDHTLHQRKGAEQKNTATS
ncbi:hypothetical protein GE061_005497 [Apolygus lucorum]|uniref:Uncharacterized protein n=1 Tax=Apolygus lucorum TaxID=248454 RepID=A0A8S9WVU4_APOLU|nr:hypothetical protein GE061_005497 [Apolygus lucorum]